ncbi:hypothetical protein AJ85_12965 [Alkalihalobacillus alcalophilus ATCC 27647 = CGMCC 1.3604]|uniref:Secreted protein n=4 Tax=Bacillaceae TaxID=186817 RepID=A0A094WM47_ALKAL|nr:MULTISPECIES: hypothetical protein [Bacillaceae]KGA97941.1 hypothetical protein BALCAV_0207195 [Alkalihalobacillus alcalophilus ATCC 27647 = CGMCC 1.3604]KHF38234.1 hypothetical protein LQ50_22475 [Halalkalibacter okhensis]MED1562717.1 hypothetical protein [Alkalihalobacillus alcalophilus]THG92344.1 hypothetical protein AJ85_12965 [Alkalihalobacillus alcalophilus ATCC 27647 = CGMCC 1.3604]GAE28141.1 secreted protein [Halalkalibacter wakoensis JCM 9140]
MEQHQHHEMQHHMHMGAAENDIITTITYQDSILNIHLEDREGSPLELLQTHEKYMHLIVVSDDLQEFYHLHPEQIDLYTYEVTLPLRDLTSYKAFVDINPKGKHYLIEANAIEGNILNHTHFCHNEMNLIPNKEKIKEISGKIVEMTHGPLKIGEDVTLHFDLKGEKPEPYLGALGHVVIIDDEVKQFIHVHPNSDHETVFVAQFIDSGFYKLWVEFKFAEQIIAFPFWIEVKEK